MNLGVSAFFARRRLYDGGARNRIQIAAARDDSRRRHRLRSGRHRHGVFDAAAQRHLFRHRDARARRRHRDLHYQLGLCRRLGRCLSVASEARPMVRQLYRIFVSAHAHRRRFSVVVARAVERSWLGYGFTAIRDDETAAEATGVPTLRLKLVATGLSGALMGMAGAPLPYYVSFLEPASTFNLSYAVNTIAMAMIGGTKTWLGPLIGAVLLGDRAAGGDCDDLVRDQSPGRRRLVSWLRHARAQRHCRSAAPPLIGH